MTTDTPTNVADSATLPDMLSLQHPAIIGVMVGPDVPAALIRSRRGDIARVTTGETAFGVTVSVIDATQVVLTDRAGAQHVPMVPRR